MLIKDAIQVGMIIGLCVVSGCAGGADGPDSAVNIPVNAESEAQISTPVVVKRQDQDELYRQFLDPNNQYRSKPFWSWNGNLQEEELIRQIHVLKEMGFGGFFMHSRTGLATEYLGEKWFELINACARQAEKLNMEAWLYDEDRWPSGTAGGLVTQNPDYRKHYIRLRTLPAVQFTWNDGIVAAFCCRLEALAYYDCRRIHRDTPADSCAGKTILVFTVEEQEKDSFYNGYTYVDTLNSEATARFIELTHEQYKTHCQANFGRAIPGIFSDEAHRGQLMDGFGVSNEDAEWLAPWNASLPEKFEQRFGYDLVEHLPELFLQPRGRRITQVKWHYVELLQQLFTENFARPLYQWCEKNDLMQTGHGLHEDSLAAQTAMTGSIMRYYEYMHYPGIDLLTEGNRSYWVVKQLASAGRQLGRNRLLSEIYGCTGWQMPFEGHKAVGDWQALFGINLRCHHLAWYTMAGEAKRDYPASIFFQSAWWKDYNYVETYFSRLGLILNQGKPCCDILVVNPVESVWCQIYPGWARHLGAQSPDVQKLEKTYRDIFHWLAGAQIDFDYGDEDMMRRMYRIGQDEKGQAVLNIGQADYRAVLVGGMTTIRSTTLQILAEFLQAGGAVIFAGEPPAYVNAVKSDQAAELASKAAVVDLGKEAVVGACEKYVRDRVQVLDRTTGERIDDVYCQLRRQGNSKYLVALNVNRDKYYKNVLIRLEGEGYLSEWNCLTGRRCAIAVTSKEGFVEFATDFPPAGEHVYLLARRAVADIPVEPVYIRKDRQTCPGPYQYVLSEKNVCVLDLARYKIDKQPWQEEMEILKVDRAVRRHYGMEIRSGKMIQPWYRKKIEPEPKIQGEVRLAFAFFVEKVPAAPVTLCIEQPQNFDVTVNGKVVSSTPLSGWWIDPCFRKIAVPLDYLQQGENRVELRTDFHEWVDIEAVYLIGDFGVRVDGIRKTLTKLPAKLAAGDITSQGLPFYSDVITYKIPVKKTAEGAERLFIGLDKFGAACVKVVSEKDNASNLIAWQPYQADITDEVKGSPTIELQVVLTRRNTFGPLHQVPRKVAGYGPDNFVTTGKAFTQEYMLYPSGLLAEPVVYTYLKYPH